MTIVRFSLRVCAAQARGDQCSLFSGTWLRGSLVGCGGGGLKSPVASGALFSTHAHHNHHQLAQGSNWTPVWDRRYSGSAGANQFGRHMTARTMGSVGAGGGKRPRVVPNEVTKSLQILSDKKINVDHDPKTLKLKNPLDERPLVVMLCWLQARQKHIEKYAEIYINSGIDVLAVQITPWQLLWPTKGTQLVARDTVNFLQINTKFNPLFLHGFSVGGYMWGECLVHIERDLAKYQPVLDRIVGQVFDSAADVSEIHIGIPKAVFPRNPKMQAALRSYIIYHMKTFHEPATSHYIRSSQMFHGNLVRSPALMFVSKKDPVGPPASNERVRENWVRNNVHMTYKLFEKSPHVGHFQMYRDEYVSYLMNHLRLVNLVKDESTERVRAKL